MTLKEARELLGGVSKGNSKMNCPCYGLPVSTCTPHRPGDVSSTCHPKNCYAQRGFYHTPSVKKALTHRLGMNIAGRCNEPERLLEAYSTVIGAGDNFRFFDSGDFIDYAHMQTVLKACEQNPDTSVWIPTKRYDLVRELRQVTFDPDGPAAFPTRKEPDNVCLRVGVWQIDPSDDTVVGYLASFGNIAIVTKNQLGAWLLREDAHTKVCKAPKQEVCLTDCNACFDRQVKLVIYPWH